MRRERVLLEVIVDLDPMPGAFATKESAAMHLQALLLSTIGHYHPVVTMSGVPELACASGGDDR